MTKHIEKRICPYSGEEFIPRRNNQVFASKNNRINYHNNKNNILRNELNPTKKQLLLNHKICINLLEGKESITIHREFLKGKGFNFSYFTNITKSKIKNDFAYQIFDISFEKNDENNYLIAKL